MDPNNPQLIAAVNAIIDEAGRSSRSVVVARGVQRILAIFEGDEIPSERNRRENIAALRQMAELGNTRDAAMKVARRMSNNPHRQRMLAQRFREFRRQQN